MRPVEVPVQLAPFFVGEPAVAALVTVAAARALATLVLPGSVSSALPALLHTKTRPPVARVCGRRQDDQNQCEQRE